ncbi:hypothetical protein BT63DRAFT_474766 [Microthyrium microscopicum]|uniref:CID domain-containing protein n=1 Tax=Microthyrium microscopicum TaxID=703497 RepID=A0A6A6UUF3_9PEZI|nr:hypothetical protein BT63DRAFT_474766 [Microthyrium microscopicum]
MADPFELRLIFSKSLRALNPCEDNSDEVVSFALKHKDLDEDLHSCILEQLENEDSSINVRANIVYFLEDLVELARREKHLAYICMIERDFPKIIDAAIPLDGLGIVNVNCVRYVLQVLHNDYQIFCTEDNRTTHNTSIHQTFDTKTFRQLCEHLEKRAYEARPELLETDSASESEPDMSWIENPTTLPMDIDPPASAPQPSTTAVLQTASPTIDTRMPDLHDIPSPPGSRSPSINTPTKTPIAPTPPSPSPSPPTLPNGHSPSPPNGTSATSPANYTPAIFSPAQPAQLARASGSSTAPSEETSPAHGVPAEAPPPNRLSPEAYTPVQREDMNVFRADYFALVAERIEQDRERQRRKEDNSGFLMTGETTEESMDILGRGGGYVGDVFGPMVGERVGWARSGVYG